MNVSRLFTAVLLSLVLWAGVATGQLMTTRVGTGQGSASVCDASFSSVVLLAGNDNAANGTTTFVDQSSHNHTLTRGAGGTVAYTTTSPPPSMASSINFPGNASTSIITTPTSVDWQYGTGNFTIEAFIRISSDTGQEAVAATMPDQNTIETFAFRTRGNGSHEWLSQFGNSTFAAWLVGAAPGSIVTFVANTWTHVAFYRNGSDFRFSFAGTTFTPTSSPQAGTGGTNSHSLAIGNLPDNTYPLTGQLASLRITKGVARYPLTNFTPPSLPFPSC